MVYLAYGLTIDSDIDLGFPRTTGDAELRVRTLDVALDNDTVVWYPNPIDDDWAYGRLPDSSFVLRFTDVVDFVIEPDGASVAWWSDHPPSPLVVHLLLDHALPQAMMRRGSLVLHAACMVSPEGACFALVGESGRGKSTLAAALLTRGHRFLGDDCAVIQLAEDGPSVVPAYPGLRLHPASLDLVNPAGTRVAGPVSETSAKLRLTLTGAQSWDGRTAVALRSIIMLSPATLTGGGIRPVPAGRAVVTLIGHSFHLGDRSERFAVFSRIADLVAGCEVLETYYEHSGPGLERALRAIEGHLTGGAGR